MTAKTSLIKDISPCIRNFYKKLSKKNVSKSDSEKESFLKSIALPNFTPKVLTYVKVKLQKNT